VSLTGFSIIISAVAAIIGIIAAVYGFYKWSYRRGHNDACLNEFWRKKDDAFTKLYAPLRVALLDTHFTVCRSTGYPSFKLRFSNALDVISTRKYLKAKLYGFIAALSDKAQSMSVECETIFPQSKIKSIVEKHPQLAGKELIDKVQEIERMTSEPWDNDEGEILKKQYYLAKYIRTKFKSIEQELHNKVLQQKTH